MMDSDVSDLPQPDSPIRPSTSPARTVNDTSSTTFTPLCRPGKEIVRCSTSSTGGASPRSRAVRLSRSPTSRSPAMGSTGSVFSVDSCAAIALGVTELAPRAAAGAAHASEIRSASTFSASTVTRISRPGNSVAHQPPVSTRSLPSASTEPHDGLGGWMPAPMNDSDASNTIASATVTVQYTSTGAAQFTATCLARMNQRRAPMIRSAAT